jgi:membrane-associated phospholipid phosphatase
LLKGRSLMIMAVLIMLSLCGTAYSVRAESGISVKEFGQTCLDDAKYILISPGEWERKEWSKAALVAGTTLALYGADREIREFFQKNRSKTSDDFSDLIGKTGDVVYLAPALGLWYLYGKHYGNSKAQEAALCSIESLLIAGGMTTVLKFGLHRSRPYTEAGPHSFDGPGFETDDDRLSFSSMHSAAAFSVATVVADYYRTGHWTPVLAYGTATMVSLSRLNDDKHWSSDVFCGAVLGYYIAKKILKRRQAEGSSETGATLSIIPQATQNGPALTLQYRF